MAGGSSCVVESALSRSSIWREARPVGLVGIDDPTPLHRPENGLLPLILLLERAAPKRLESLQRPTETRGNQGVVDKSAPSGTVEKLPRKPPSES